MLEEDDIRHALSQIHGANEAQDIVAAGRVQGVVIKSGNVGFSLEVGGLATETLEALKQQAEAAVGAIKGVLSVTCVMTAHKAAPAVEAQASTDKPAREPNREVPEVFDRIGAVIAVASGKGGVGKSTTAINLALAFQHLGQSVAILDADIYGPSLPRLLGTSQRPVAENNKLMPIKAHGLTAMSIGFLMDEDAPTIWRGPMVMSALEQMLRDVEWGEPDILIIDMPPGTGDAQLTLSQRAKLAGAIIVSTPQDLALIDARKGLNMFRKVHVPVLGIIENMSYFVCPDCHSQHDIFSRGGAEDEAKRLGLPFLGAIPLEISIREGADAGKPVLVSDPDGPLSKAYLDIAKNLLDTLPEQSRPAPKITIS